ncbi:hypothetical protein [Novosphingobium sp. FSW06-99]|uniref:hypothetical protein n=1 Tax=Novosphingobium sp. FSW06-99 TaxID=1739113 RepID=UPI00076C6A79|nr:hypothetical protein [Novosphingobium sp. FSW06-99]KUR78555.1 hypothetical protein AQZ49_06800 [Novosphingobium sp. FSW06-99]
MHVAIDDTYGPITATPSKYITGARRTYVAVEFPDHAVGDIRRNITNCLDEIPNLLGINPTEFHFVDIYNRSKEWKDVPDEQNLKIFESFAQIYRMYRWRVHVQTVDDRTLSDHGFHFDLTVDGIDLRERDGQALFFLLVKLKQRVPRPPERLTLRIDAGRAQPGKPIAKALFSEWGPHYDGQYAASHLEPLIQIADFLAFSINRVTHLSLKPQRTELDLWFLNLVGSMDILSDDLARGLLPPNFTTTDIDDLHSADRKQKGLE